MKHRLLLALLPVAFPLIHRWTRRQTAIIERDGQPLDEPGLRYARMVGVQEPERIRLLAVDRIPMPGRRLLQRFGPAIGLTWSEVAGLCLGHAIYVCRDCAGDALLVAHECVHTAQTERLGGYRAFLYEYLRQCLDVGYIAAPLEVEAMTRTRQLARELGWIRPQGEG